MHGHMNVKLKINFFCPQLKTARLASLVNNKICFIFVDIKLNENSVCFQFIIIDGVVVIFSLFLPSLNFVTGLLKNILKMYPDIFSKNIV